jgi:hypothetical protein
MTSSFPPMSPEDRFLSEEWEIPPLPPPLPPHFMSEINLLDPKLEED